jgi:hypothetical protein
VEGSFTFVSPPGQKLSLVEIIDILNESLLKKDRLLIRQAYVNHRFTVVRASKKIGHRDVDFLQSHKLLAKYGNTEVVRLVLQPQRALVADVVPAIKKLLGPFGEVVPVASTNHLFLQDMAGNLRAVCKAIQKLEESEQKADPASAAGPPVEGKVTTTDASGLVTVSIGSDSGVRKGHVLEVYRFDPTPTYLGRLEVLESRPNEAVGRPVSRPPGHIQVGDRVANRIITGR